MTLEYHPLANLFPLMEGSDFDELCDDIKGNGLREAIIMLDGMILDGRNRQRACDFLGMRPPYDEYDPSIDGEDPVKFVISKNLKRRHLDISQRAMIGHRLETYRMGGDRRSEDQHANLRPDREAIATSLNISARSINDAAKVAANAVPEIVAAVDQGKMAISAAAKVADLPADQQREVARQAQAGKGRAAGTALKKAKRAEKEKELGDKQGALPLKKYGVILADPAWDFKTWDKDTGGDRSAANHYPTAQLGDIAVTDVQSISADDCVLFLWATVPMLPQALSVLAAWGFNYKSHFIWSKPKAGTGYWNRNKHELLLVGTRGDVPAPAPGTQWPSVIEEKATVHSAKPDIFYELVERYFPTLPKIELNAREKRKGWDSHGTLEGRAA